MRAEPPDGPPPWARAAGTAAVLAALPTVVWRVVVGLGAPLGTPELWRRAQQLPGAGTGYVLGLSAVQLVAALATLALIVPGADRVPGTGRPLPAALVAGASFAGAAVLAFLCVASAIAWSRVDPFAGAPASGWSLLCHACYLVAPAWPVLLAATTVGYLAHRRASRA